VDIPHISFPADSRPRYRLGKDFPLKGNIMYSNSQGASGTGRLPADAGKTEAGPGVLAKLSVADAGFDRLT